MYAFGGLPENLASFCAFLRREYGFRLGAGELLDAARALEVVNIASPHAVRHGLRAVLATTRDDAAAFDQGFERFFFARQREEAVERGDADGGEGTEVTSPRPPRADASTAEADDRLQAGAGGVAPIESGEEQEWSAFGRAHYSPVEAGGSDTPEVPEADGAWVDAARALVRRVQLGLSRRWRPSVTGRRFDLRRTLRASLQTGGETLAPRWLGRPRRTSRFVLLLDGSRSMSEHTQAALRIASAIARVTSRIEVFAFSTGIKRVTTDLRRAGGGRSRRLQHLAFAWGGGTCIGASLSEFLRRFGERLVGADTVVILLSDGLDVGEPETLRASMRRLRGRAAAVVWLNPLADTPGYEPTALGMSVARPFVTTFTSANDLAGFVRLSQSVRVKA